MAPYYADEAVTLHHGDCLDVLRELPASSVDAVCTDPPYGLADHHPRVVAAALSAWLTGDREHVPDGRGFMGRDWDRFVPPPAVWDECLRVLKPGGHLLAFAGSRTEDLMAMSIRLAGFEIRDGIDWLYASGFPKSLDVSKAIDKAAGASREVIGTERSRIASTHTTFGDDNWTGVGQAQYNVTAPATDDARRWSGWGTALKPAREPIVVARKPLAGTVAGNVLAYGTGALNIDACRVGTDSTRRTQRGTTQAWEGGAFSGDRLNGSDSGRWPSNVVLSHAPDCTDVCLPGCPVAELDRQSGITRNGGPVPSGTRKPPEIGAAGLSQKCATGYAGDSGGASRFFPVFRYEAKAPTAERPRTADGTAHPTVKPLDLMRWLVRLVTPTGGTVLEPFAGSGTTAEACVIEGLRCIAIERDETYLPLITARLTKALQPALDFGAVA